MRPILIKIGEIGIPSYGIMLVISFIVAIFLVKRSAKKYNIAPNIIENLAFYVMIGVILGGRILYVIFHWSEYEQNILNIFALWQGGMMFFGGFIGGLVVGLLYLKKEKIPIFVMADLIAPAIALGTFFTRIGCFLNGCCYGLPSHLPWAVQFPESCAAGTQYPNTTIHPTELYASLFGLALFFFLWQRLKKKRVDGEIFALYLIFYGGFRFGIDFIRFYENAGNFWINQIISLLAMISGVLILIKLFKKKV